MAHELLEPWQKISLAKLKPVHFPEGTKLFNPASKPEDSFKGYYMHSSENAWDEAFDKN